jgi:integrase
MSIGVEDMPAWYEGLGKVSAIGSDYLLLVLLTGLRRREAAALRWQDVDLDKSRTLTVHDTNNGRDHVLPLSTQLLDGRALLGCSCSLAGRPGPVSLRLRA